VTHDPDIRVEEAVVADAELLSALTRLLPQLSSSAPAPTAYEIEDIVDSAACRLLVARDRHGATLGSLTLAVFRVPTGMRAWIEDVVVDGDARGRGIGRALVEAALRLAAESGARTVDLTSRPSREAANHLYEEAGFERRQTNVWRYSIA
jgi:ribosomal protein S18 acetylase RimI-like enzyme